MSELQLSFLVTEPSAFDVNAIDDSVISVTTPIEGAVSAALSQRSVDDWVFGLGFTNWKVVIDHALRTGHFELFESEDGCLGLRKHGYRYAPIPRLPAGGPTYVQQRLLAIASERNSAPGRHERMVAVNSEFSHKCVVEQGICDVTIKQCGAVVRASIQVGQMNFSDQCKADAEHLAAQLARVLVNSGAQDGQQLAHGCLSLASHILRVIHGAR